MPLSELGITGLPTVRGALVFISAEFGLFSSPFVVDGVWVGWGKAIRKRLGEETAGRLPADEIAKRLSRELRAGWRPAVGRAAASPFVPVLGTAASLRSALRQLGTRQLLF